MDLDTLAQVRHALSAALRPRVTPPARVQNPLWPIRNVPALRGVAPGKAPVAPATGGRGTTAPAMGTATKPRARPDDSRTIGFDLDPVHGVVINLPPMPRHSPEQQQRAADLGASLLADAQPIAEKVAPGIAVSVALRGRVIASTDPARVVAVTPGDRVVRATLKVG